MTKHKKHYTRSRKNPLPPPNHPRAKIVDPGASHGPCRTNGQEERIQLFVMASDTSMMIPVSCFRCIVMPTPKGKLLFRVDETGVAVSTYNGKGRIGLEVNTDAPDKLILRKRK